MNKLTLASVAAALALVASAQADTLTLSKVHLCCNSCVKGIATATADTGAKVACDKDAGTVTIDGDKDTITKTLAAIVKAGYWGTSSDAAIKPKGAGKQSDAKMETIKVEGVHLCCKKCVKGLNEALAGVDGFKSTDAVEKTESFTISGNCSPKDVMAALHKGGFAGKIAK